jgi:hypothetical protein
MTDIDCPYCDCPQEINHDDGYGYQEDTPHQQTCSNCKKTFVYHTIISFDYVPKRADCLNDAEHDFQPTSTYPKRFTKMECTICEEKRNPTDEEKKQFLIPEK